MNKYYKNIIFAFLTVIVLSCKMENKKEFPQQKNEEVQFKDSIFKKIFKMSLDKLEDPMDSLSTSKILEFYIDPYMNYDTIVSIKNCPPINVKNLIHVKRYKNQLIYIYYTENLKNSVSKFIDIDSRPIDSVILYPVPNEFECIYRKRYILKNKQFKPIE